MGDHGRLMFVQAPRALIKICVEMRYHRPNSFLRTVYDGGLLREGDKFGRDALYAARESAIPRRSRFTGLSRRESDPTFKWICRELNCICMVAGFCYSVRRTIKVYSLRWSTVFLVGMKKLKQPRDRKDALV